ncbi:Glutamate racemase [Shewanella piezotolerans WP3]|uniref:Glutamate racemase n=1 Tax=Shewanella piezotolerans (strain WP3 / JCM 13877) TaxID=225849 RepID=MURI_SHEPW|nr:glutamate racemase [Shewanella piezotolerans]B8CH57.1 RecName: Full=Glutamate racemase [Shewanella piezotolerans WP3]ACJ27050.1 Glutamate racemase [Shewanella piezotolerans WP3]
MSGPILIFDSGIGGLSILDEIRKVMPQQSCCYLFDNARLPYGELEESELISGCVSLIIEQAMRINAGIVVVACNSASTLVLTTLREQLSIPVVGVVPAIKPAAKISKRRHIGLLATPGTIKRPYTKQLIDAFAEDCRVELFGSSELVMLAEAKLAGTAVDMQKLELLLAPIRTSELDTLVLGCTHFPVLATEIKQSLGQSIILLDSGKAVADRVLSLLKGNGLPKTASNKVVDYSAVFTTDDIAQGLKKRLVEEGFTSIEPHSSTNLR